MRCCNASTSRGTHLDLDTATAKAFCAVAICDIEVDDATDDGGPSIGDRVVARATRLIAGE